MISFKMLILSCPLSDVWLPKCQSPFGRQQNTSCMNKAWYCSIKVGQCPFCWKKTSQRKLAKFDWRKERCDLQWNPLERPPLLNAISKVRYPEACNLYPTAYNVLQNSLISLFYKPFHHLLSYTKVLQISFEISTKWTLGTPVMKIIIFVNYLCHGCLGPRPTWIVPD